MAGMGRNKTVFEAMFKGFMGVFVKQGDVPNICGGKN